MYWSAQLFGHSFQKSRNFTGSSHQNVGFRLKIFENSDAKSFNIWIFKNFQWGVIPRNLTAEGGDPLPHQTPIPAFGTQTLVPLNFSAVVAPVEAEAPVEATLIFWGNPRINRSYIYVCMSLAAELRLHRWLATAPEARSLPRSFSASIVLSFDAHQRNGSRAVDCHVWCSDSVLRGHHLLMTTALCRYKQVPVDASFYTII